VPGIIVLVAASSLLAGCEPGAPTDASIETATTQTAIADLASQEAYLTAGVRPDLRGACIPQRDDLPHRAVAGIMCPSADSVPARVGVYLMASVDDLMATYVEGLAAYGADISAPTTTTVDGRSTTLFTASTPAGLNGVLGCPAEDMSPGDCYGLQVYAQVRLAVIDDDGTPVLAWARVVPGSPDAEHDFTAFDELLGTVSFR
jgi:hypothetical protein